jgi:hypothetical protein
MDRVIEHAVSHHTEFHQFMLYTPIPGTPLYEEHRAAGTLLPTSECPEADAHGQYRFNYRHPHIPAGAEAELLQRAFRRDFEVNGPSVLRIVETLLRGWRRHRRDPDPRVRARVGWECRELPTLYAGALWAAERWYAGTPRMAARLVATRRSVVRAFGLRARMSAPIVGRVLLGAMRRENRRLARGWTYEPPTFYEVNEAAAALDLPAWRRAARASWLDVAPAQATGEWAAAPAVAMASATARMART